MCNFLNTDGVPFGYIVDTPEIRALVERAEQLMATVASDAERLEGLRPAFAELLAAEDWLPEEYATPDEMSGMGGGIGQYALYRAEDGSLCLFSLVIPAGATTPIHDHLAWGLIGVYRGRQAEVVYRRVDDGGDEGHAELEIIEELTAATGDFYALLPPAGDIHEVTTISDGPSVSIHLLTNDTACVWRHSFNRAEQTVTPFRSGYSNAPCVEDEVAADD